MGENNGQSCRWAVAREGEAPAEPQLWLICGHSGRQGQREFEPTKNLSSESEFQQDSTHKPDATAQPL